MNILKLTYRPPNETRTLRLWINEDEIAYISREDPSPGSNIIMINKPPEFTMIAFKSGRNIMVDETPDEILKMINPPVGNG